MSQSLNLFRLQKLDTTIDNINIRLTEIDQKLSDDRRVEHAENILSKVQVEAKNARIELSKIEDKVEALRIKRKTSQAALFGGKIKNPKELQDLQMESDALKRYITQLEDEQLEAMIIHEGAEQAEKQAVTDLKNATGNSAEANAELLGERTKLKEDLNRLLREKEAVLQAIPKESMALYQRLRKTKRGAAVVSVSDGGCSICGQALTPADQQSIRASNSLVFCPSCGRILFQG